MEHGWRKGWVGACSSHTPYHIRNGYSSQEVIHGDIESLLTILKKPPIPPIIVEIRRAEANLESAGPSAKGQDAGQL